LLAGKYLLFPIAVYALTRGLCRHPLPMIVQIALLLLIVSVAVHFAMVGLGLVMFGAEGSRTNAFSDATFNVGSLMVSAQSLWVIGTAVVLMVALYLYFDRTISGKALRATSVNRVGAQLVGIGTTQAGRVAFTLAACLGALSGMLVAPLTTIYYDSGFLMGLKGFVGAIIGGLVSYPLAAAGAVLVGLLESYSSFWASAYKEVIVFTLIIPVLLWRSLATPHAEEAQE
jgi:branched-chain amino acid transport system permease protein